MTFRKATAQDQEQVSALYHAAIGMEGCTWNEDYPGQFEIEGDFQTGNLYVLISEGKVIGAVSVVPENELDGMTCWNLRDETQREIARVVVSRSHAGQGLAARMLTQLFQELKASGCNSIHLSVAKCNQAAIRTYRKLGFAFVGECDMYGNHYYLCELEIGGARC